MCANFTKSIAMPIKMAATKYCTKCNLSQVWVDAASKSRQAMAYVIFDQNSLSGRLEASHMRNLSFLCAFTNNVVKWLNFQQTGQQQKENFFWGQAQIQHIHQCAEHRSNTIKLWLYNGIDRLNCMLTHQAKPGGKSGSSSLPSTGCLCSTSLENPGGHG